MSYQFANRHYERVRLPNGSSIEFAFDHKPTAKDIENAKGKLEAVRAKERDTLDPVDELEQVKAERDRLKEEVERLESEVEKLESDSEVTR